MQCAPDQEAHAGWIWASWVHADRGIIPSPVNTLVIDPAKPLVLYAGMAYGGLYKTTTGGE